MTKVISTIVITTGLLAGCQESTPIPPADNKTHINNQMVCITRKQPIAYSHCAFDKEMLHSSLHLYWQQGNQPLYTFANLENYLLKQTPKHSLLFAMNAGMYNQDFAPIGYTVINSKQILSLNLKQGAGNFHLMPNGVFWWDKTGFYIDTSSNMAKKLQSGIKPNYATQSGPMLVIDGNIHPKFDPNSTSVKIRNGVGVDCQDDKIHFVISDTPVTFYQFADVFKNTLQCQNALFLDGGIASALYAPQINRHDKLNMAVMLAVSMPTN